jgi:hypothetical protein
MQILIREVRTAESTGRYGRETSGGRALPTRPAAPPSRYTTVPTRPATLPGRYTGVPTRPEALPRRYTGVPTRPAILPSRYRPFPVPPGASPHAPGRFHCWIKGCTRSSGALSSGVVGSPAGGTRGRTRLENVEACLMDRIAEMKRLGVGPIAGPPLGCRNGPLDWTRSVPELQRSSAQVSDVRLLCPAGRSEVTILRCARESSSLKGRQREAWALAPRRPSLIL